jgi:hypothetical protein
MFTPSKAFHYQAQRTIHRLIVNKDLTIKSMVVVLALWIVSIGTFRIYITVLIISTIIGSPLQLQWHLQSTWHLAYVMEKYFATCSCVVCPT